MSWPDARSLILCISYSGTPRVFALPFEHALAPPREDHGSVPAGKTTPACGDDEIPSLGDTGRTAEDSVQEAQWQPFPWSVDALQPAGSGRHEALRRATERTRRWDVQVEIPEWSGHSTDPAYQGGSSNPSTKSSAEEPGRTSPVALLFSVAGHKEPPEADLGPDLLDHGHGGPRARSADLESSAGDGQTLACLSHCFPAAQGTLHFPLLQAQKLENKKDSPILTGQEDDGLQAPFTCTSPMVCPWPATPELAKDGAREGWRVCALTPSVTECALTQSVTPPSAVLRPPAWPDTNTQDQMHSNSSGALLHVSRGHDGHTMDHMEARTGASYKNRKGAEAENLSTCVQTIEVSTRPSACASTRGDFAAVEDGRRKAEQARANAYQALTNAREGMCVCACVFFYA